ncbi:Cu(I)-responsive transcriptional regulator (plasmid) [Rhizobium sp. WSM1274]|uniref:Cu(I)-responsive transcriptional regulator n=1 Tax=Rhizobium sp. WSM1274 TaxID=3138254 RepID=UPI0021A7B7CB|nr:Cu(I)-responsive transcriptional regulator [Rhizobium leguminosarum]UWU32073.1 Cu(I)-responsive transcriptional regulator [Rhizobium leguminosarum bv. viciae]
MNIGEASERSGLPSKTIRYYEDIGLIRPKRGGNGYRDYAATDVHKLRFLQRSRGLGFSVAECRQLLALYEDKDRASIDVKDIAETKLAEIDRKIRELTELRRTLEHLVHACHGNDRPDCPILEELSDGGWPFRESRRRVSDDLHQES